MHQAKLATDAFGTLPSATGSVGAFETTVLPGIELTSEPLSGDDVLPLQALGSFFIRRGFKSFRKFHGAIAIECRRTIQRHAMIKIHTSIEGFLRLYVTFVGGIAARSLGKSRGAQGSGYQRQKKRYAVFHDFGASIPKT